MMLKFGSKLGPPVSNQAARLRVEGIATTGEMMTNAPISDHDVTHSPRLLPHPPPRVAFAGCSKSKARHFPSLIARG